LAPFGTEGGSTSRGKPEDDASDRARRRDQERAGAVVAGNADQRFPRLYEASVRQVRIWAAPNLLFMDPKGSTPQKHSAPERNPVKEDRRPRKEDRRPGRSGEGADSVVPHLKDWERTRARARALKER
jgi:hypothetical protein